MWTGDLGVRKDSTLRFACGRRSRRKLCALRVHRQLWYGGFLRLLNAADGNDRGLNPYELLLMALGACTAMTIRLYVERKKWPLTRIAMRLRHGRIYVRDCADCETK